MHADPLDFSLRVVTPAFIAGAMEDEAATTLRYKDKTPRHRRIGADGDGLRVPSLRGILRFWFRAKEGLGDWGRLARREAEVFGGTEVGQGLRFMPLGASAWSPMPIRADAGGAEAYLGYGVLHFEQGEVSSHNKFAFRDAIPPGTVFSFRALGSARQLEELRRTLLLLHLFGGVGSRSRRGWGSVTVAVDSPLASPLAPPRTDDESLAGYLSRCLAAVWPEAEGRPSQRPADPLYSAFWREAEMRCFERSAEGSELTHPRQVLEAFFAQLKATRLFRREAPAESPAIARQDYEAEAATADGEAVARLPLRLAFGMPYAVRFKHKDPVEYTARYRREGQKIEITRRASPLFLKVFETSSGKFGGTALFLRSRFFAHAGAKIGAKHKRGELDPPDYTAVEAFLRESPWTSLTLP